jgi:HEAT repeats
MHRKKAKSLSKGHDYRFIAATKCLESMTTLKGPDLLAIIPHISVLRDPRFLDPLVAMLEDPNGRKREFAILALGALRDPRALPILVRCFKALDKGTHRSRWGLQLAIVHTLGDIGSDEATPILKGLLRTLPATPRHRTDRELRIIGSLGHIAQQGGTQAQELLMEMAAGRNTLRCVHAIPEIAVSFWHRPSDVPPKVLRLLLDRLDDPDVHVQEAAFGALENLADLGCLKAEQALVKLFKTS